MTSKETDTRAIDAAGTDTTLNNPTTDDTVSARLQALERMDYPALRAEWRRVYRSPPPKRVARNLLLLGIAWKIQERIYGGLGAATKRRLADLAKSIERNGDITRNRVTQLKLGAKLVREWRGKTHIVIVVEDGFEWKGDRWRSLTAIAREITGGHWSGPRFFGLTETARPGVGIDTEEVAGA